MLIYLFSSDLIAKVGFLLAWTTVFILACFLSIFALLFFRAILAASSISDRVFFWGDFNMNPGIGLILCSVKKWLTISSDIIFCSIHSRRVTHVLSNTLYFRNVSNIISCPTIESTFPSLIRISLNFEMNAINWYLSIGFSCIR